VTPLTATAMAVSLFTGVLAAFLAVQPRAAQPQPEVRERSMFREQARDRLVEALGQLGEHLSTVFAAAGRSTTGVAFAAQTGVAAALGASVAGFVGGISGATVGWVAGALPYLQLRALAARRTRQIVEQLPEALDHLSRSLSAGVSLHEALRLCGEEMPAPIRAEFATVSEEIRFGFDLREALRHVLDRHPGVFDLRLFCAALVLQRDTGGNLVEILDNLSHTVRGRFLFAARVRALTSEARFSAWILGGLPLVVFVLLRVVHPDYLSPLFADPLGHVLIAYFVTSYAVGGLLMRRIARVEVA
jgi:tight adherence protein B